MSRTHKDRPYKHSYAEEHYQYGQLRVPYDSERFVYEYIDGQWANTGKVETVTGYYYLTEAGVKTKKPRSHNERHWMPTPMWWIREFMTQPQRTRGKEWERRVVKCDGVDSIIDLDQPTVSRKPHLYFW